MTEQSKMPARIWAWPKPRHASKKPDGGWESWKDYDDAILYIRADLVEPLVEALRECRTSICGYAITDSAQYPEVLFRINNELQRIDKRIRAALSSLEAGQ